MSDGERGLLESEIRLALWRQFGGAVTLGRVMDDGASCLLEHGDGTRGVVPVGAVVMVGCQAVAGKGEPYGE